MIPAFNISGVLPPFTGAEPGNRAQMSPYKSTVLDMARHLGTSLQRVELLIGLLMYRTALKASGVSLGFQWIDGSFVEDVEVTRGRPPADIDVVTFGRLPGTPQEFLAAHEHLLDARRTKQMYKCDAYFVDLGKDSTKLVDDTRYWFGLFSHQRETSLWKGMLQINLDEDDSDATQYLEAQRDALRAAA
ncbi:DUF6932 family protein [Achromobacter denitrificans]|uniref:DUF6932 family protein n=1 Tax=Achromobacter denitrificans TaxID=32002 RepID=UPI000F679DF3|nr:hypothetical protein [Achromobacter denitrificans]RSE88615.1 hypothetical protein EGU64_05180 [Achromobacter denitrificans]